MGGGEGGCGTGWGGVAGAGGNIFSYECNFKIKKYFFFLGGGGGGWEGEGEGKRVYSKCFITNNPNLKKNFGGGGGGWGRWWVDGGMGRGGGLE